MKSLTCSINPGSWCSAKCVDTREKLPMRPFSTILLIASRTFVESLSTPKKWNMRSFSDGLEWKWKLHQNAVNFIDALWKSWLKRKLLTSSKELSEFHFPPVMAREREEKVRNNKCLCLVHDDTFFGREAHGKVQDLLKEQIRGKRNPSSIHICWSQILHYTEYLRFAEYF